MKVSPASLSQTRSYSDSEGISMNMKSIEDVFIHLLSDTYSAEKQLTRGLAKLARAASSEKLSAAFNAHLEETGARLNVSTRLLSRNLV